MGKTQVKIVEAVCDRCGVAGDTSNSSGRIEWGELDISYKGHMGSRNAMGEGAGSNIRGQKWLCLDCAKKFLQFLDAKRI